MLEFIWRLRTATLDDESVVRPLMAALAEVPGFVPDRYDLNQKEQWRGFDLDRAVVDALTQRTQLVRIEGDQEGALAMIATGKRDEQPTAILRLPGAEQADLDALISRWTALYEALPLESTLISASRWRRALSEAGLAPDAAGSLMGMVFGWQRGAQPQGLSEIEPERLEDTPIRIDQEANHLVLRLADAPRVDDEAHAAALEYVARRLLRTQR